MEFPLPSELQLPDGRRLRASWSEAMPGMPPPRTQHTVELDARDLQGPLSVRWPLPRDRFHGLGAPGSKPLRRFLSDQKLPPYERGRVPLVVCGSEIIWVVGLRPCHRHRVRSDTARRLRLELRAE